MCTMAAHTNQIKYIIALVLISLHLSTTLPAKPNARPVHEITNEQSRIDEKVKPASNTNIPYGNPLAGNSKQNARLHAQNQQAMFNAERVRQHRAQLQRWTKAPQKVDSYMKAYHESQENHQLAIEQQQAKARENKKAFTANKSPRATQAQNTKEDNMKRSPKVVQNADLSRTTKVDAVPNYERNRNHRSYGSVEYQQYLQPKKYKNIYISPAPTYDQGVTIKPNGNEGLAELNNAEEFKLYTQAIPSKTVYPKQYYQMQNYQSAQDIDNLNALLNKTPNDQLSELSALLKSGHHNSEPNKESLDTPIDLYFYLKDRPEPSLPQHYEQSMYAQIGQNYANSFTEIKDHTPITEEVDDVEDPNKNRRPRPYGLHSVLPTQTSEEQVDTTTTKSNNYYKVEVASQTISAPYKHSHKVPTHYEEEVKPTYQALQYAHHPTPYHKNINTEGDESERYLHHNAQHKGIQHLTEDGTGVSAYGSDNLHYAANYEFGYRVRDQHSGNDFGHHEAKSGGNTNGHYHVLLPDGRMQQVKYSAGPGGFHADISYDHLQ